MLRCLRTRSFHDILRYRSFSISSIPKESRENVSIGKDLTSELELVLTMVDKRRGSHLNDTELRHCRNTIATFRNYGLPLACTPLATRALRNKSLLLALYSEIIQNYEQTEQYNDIVEVYDALVKLKHKIDPEIAWIFIRACRIENCEKALTVFDHVPYTTIEMYNEAILAAPHQVDAFHQQLKADQLTTDATTEINTVIAHCRNGDVTKMWKMLHSVGQEMKDTAYQELIKECSRLGKFQDAEKLMDLLQNDADTSTYKTLIRAYSKADMLPMGLTKYEEMKKKKVKLDVDIWTSLLEACSKPQEKPLSRFLLNSTYLTAGIVMGAVTFPGWAFLGIKMQYSGNMGDVVLLGSSLTTALTYTLFRSQDLGKTWLSNFSARMMTDLQANRAVYLWQDMDRLGFNPSDESKTAFVQACVANGHSDFAYKAMFSDRASRTNIPFEAACIFLESIQHGKMRTTAKDIFQDIWGASFYQVQNGRREYNLRKFSLSMCTLALESELEKILQYRNSKVFPKMVFYAEHPLKRALVKAYPTASKLVSHRDVRSSKTELFIPPSALEAWVRREAIINK